MTLLQAKPSDNAIILEMGMRGMGEIQRLSYCAHPDIAVITNIGSAHIGRLGSRMNIAKAKCEIITHLKPTGVVIIPYGELLLEEILRDNWGGRIVRVDLNQESSSRVVNPLKDSKYLDVSPDYSGILDLDDDTLLVEGVKLKLPLEGKHNAKNFMLALAVARELGVSFENIKNIRVDMPSGRNRLIKYGSLIIMDETYNASPESVEASIELLVRKPGRHFVVLGTMLELGSKSESLHLKVVQRILDLGIDGMVVVAKGEEAKAIDRACKNLSKFALVSTPEEAITSLSLWLKPGDVLLLKASRGVELERILPLIKRTFS